MNGIEFYPLFDNERIYSLISEVKPLRENNAEIAKILRNYPDEAPLIYERIKGRYKDAMEINRSIESQFRKIESGYTRSLFVTYGEDFESGRSI